MSVNFLSSRGIDRVCIIVYPDQSFRFEKAKQQISETRPRSSTVSEGHLTQSESAQLTALLQNPDVATAGTVRPPSVPSFQQELRLIAAELPRDKFRTQEISETVLDRHPLDPGVKPLLEFVDAIDSRNPPRNKNLQADACRKPPAKAVTDNQHR